MRMSVYMERPSLIEQYRFIKECRFNGIQGVWRIDSGRPGPILGITLHTHGNEPSGLATLSYFRTVYKLERELKKGSVIFVLNNMKAVEHFLRARSRKAKIASRSIDINMNRLPENTMVQVEDTRYEIVRAQQLEPVWKIFDIGFDIHSMTQNASPMIINIGKIHEDLIRGFPIETIISNIENVQIGKPAVYFYGKRAIPVMGIESGSHENARSFRRSVACVSAILQNLGLIDGQSINRVEVFKEYYIDWSLKFPDSSYMLVKLLSAYEFVKQGQVLATNGKDNIKAPFDGHAFFCSPMVKPRNIAEEALFLSRPVKVISLK